MTTVPVTVHDRLPIPPGAIRRPAAAAASGLTFNDVIRILRQRIFLILFVWFFLTGVTGVATWYLVKNHQAYRAETMIEVESQGPRNPLQLDTNFNVAVEMLNRWLTNQAQLVKHVEVLDAAFKDPGVRSTSWYSEGIQKYGDTGLFEKLEDDLGVSPIPNTSFLLVTFSAPNPKDARTIVNTIVRKYLDLVRVRSKTELSTKLAEMTAQRDLLQKELNAAREEKERYIGTSINAPGFVSGVNVVGEQWRALAVEASRLEAEKLMLEGAWENLKDTDPAQLALSPQMQAYIQQDPQVMALSNALINLRQQHQSLLSRAGPNHRELKLLASQIDATQKTYDDLVRQKQTEIRDFQTTSAETAFMNALKTHLSLKERVTAFEAAQRDLDQKLARVSSLEDRQEMLKAQYERVADFVQQLGLLNSSQETIRVRQVGEATEPLRRSFPRWELNMPVGSFLGLLVGVGLALLLDIASTSLRTPRDIVRHVHVPILGTVPDLDDEEVDIERMELASHTAPRSMIAEAFRAIRTNLLLSSPAERQRTILVTSSKPEEGKTSVAVNLAIAIGQSGRRVLLVDANFHRPALRGIFPKAPQEGLSNILIGRGRLEDLAAPTELPNLDVLACGPIPPNPTELLGSRYLTELLSQAAGRYDQVILDGPPVLLVSDALVLASAVDGVIMVCRAKSASRGVVQRAREQLERVNARIFGAVLNAAQVARGGYFREQMRSYYDYQPEQALVANTTRALPKEDGEVKDDSRP